MNKRMDTIKSLVSLSKSLNDISSDLAMFGWDYEGEPLVVTSPQIIEVLQLYISGRIGADVLEQWANMLECREDIVFEKNVEDKLENIIYCLANPELEGAITSERCKQFVKELSSEQRGRVARRHRQSI